MKSKIEKELFKTPLLKARQIAKAIGEERSAVNACLYEHPELFIKNETHHWSLLQGSELKVEFSAGWVNASLFEKKLKQAGCPISSPCTEIAFVMPHDCSILLEASARMLALCNQLVEIPKQVTLDFTGNLGTLTFLSRCGFIDRLDNDVIILPERPRISRSKLYFGNSNNLIEIREISLKAPDDSIPEQLETAFVRMAGEQYRDATFTIFSELYNNVCHHSQSHIPGFAALQVYKGRTQHIQTVVSDNGIGIAASLIPILKERYPKLAKKYDLTKQKDGLRLIKKMVEEGQITSRPKEEGDGGLGLFVTHEKATKFDAKYSVRQETSELLLAYKGGILARCIFRTDMPIIHGTQVCIDFTLD